MYDTLEFGKNNSVNHTVYRRWCRVNHIAIVTCVCNEVLCSTVSQLYTFTPLRNQAPDSPLQGPRVCTRNAHLSPAQQIHHFYITINCTEQWLCGYVMWFVNFKWKKNGFIVRRVWGTYIYIYIRVITRVGGIGGGSVGTRPTLNVFRSRRRQPRAQFLLVSVCAPSDERGKKLPIPIRQRERDTEKKNTHSGWTGGKDWIVKIIS